MPRVYFSKASQRLSNHDSSAVFHGLILNASLIVPSNKPLEWTGLHLLSAAPPQAPCLPLRGSVSPTVAKPWRSREHGIGRIQA